MFSDRNGSNSNIFNNSAIKCHKFANIFSAFSGGLGPQCSGHGLQVVLVERESSKAMFVARNSNCFMLHCARNVALHFACFIQLPLSVTCFYVAGFI